MARVYVFSDFEELMTKIYETELQENIKFIKQSKTRNFGCDGTRCFTQTCMIRLSRFGIVYVLWHVAEHHIICFFFSAISLKLIPAFVGLPKMCTRYNM